MPEGWEGSEGRVQKGKRQEYLTRRPIGTGGLKSRKGAVQHRMHKKTSKRKTPKRLRWFQTNSLGARSTVNKKVGWEEGRWGGRLMQSFTN